MSDNMSNFSEIFSSQRPYQQSDISLENFLNKPQKLIIFQHTKYEKRGGSCKWRYYAPHDGWPQNQNVIVFRYYSLHLI